jgi:hypothetical protein
LAEEFLFDDVEEPVLPFGHRPALLDDEKVVGRAVDEGEEGVDRAAPI